MSKYIVPVSAIYDLEYTVEADSILEAADEAMTLALDEHPWSDDVRLNAAEISSASTDDQS